MEKEQEWFFQRYDMLQACVLVAQLCLTLCDPVDCSLPGSSVHGMNSPGQNTGVGCHSLLQGIFPAQGLNKGLLHCRQILYCLSNQGSPQLLCSWNVLKSAYFCLMVPKWFFFTMTKLQLFDSWSLREFEKYFSVHFDHLL